MWTAAACVAIVLAVLVVTWTVGRPSALRAERAIGAWAWPIYAFLGAGMSFGAIATGQVLLSTFMWTKVTVFLLTGLWLAARQARNRMVAAR